MGMDYISANIANEQFMVYAVNMQLPRAIYMYRQIFNISRTLEMIKSLITQM